ncbi:hypothetical protein B0H13DRAFT_1987378 [Mycena leptocephala]|nr:hypothetical protein B0H13DRAFT_1987378 [Mycena leptocephala]
MSLSQNSERFPCRRPVDRPPPVRNDLVDGWPTPTYVLAWVCPARKFFENLGGGTLGKVNYRNFSDVVSEKWVARPGFGLAHAPLPYPGADGNFYLVAMFNRPDADHFTRVRNVAEDPLIESARVSMGVDQDKALEDSLQWYRWPLHWLHAEQRELERLEELTQLQSELEENAPSQGAVH